MSRTTERARGIFFRGGGSLRAMSMVAMLVVIGMLIFRAGDPASWVWMTGELNGDDAKPSPVAKIEPAQSETVTAGLTDTDVEEREAAAEQFQALTDGTLAMAREEMPAYWRVFNWTEHQSLAELAERSDKTAVLNQFLQTPDEQRGKLFQFDLNVRRVLSYPAPANSAGIKRVYEVTGWTTESKAWLYVVLTAHLPPGMPTGPDVRERVRFAGYFLKVQGYHAAGAAPQDKPLGAPLLIGRMSWDRPPEAAAPANSAGVLAYWPVAVAMLLGGAVFAVWFCASKRGVPSTNARHQSEAGGLHDWLATAQRGTMDEPSKNADIRFRDN